MDDIPTRTMHPQEPQTSAARVMLVVFHRGRARVLSLLPGQPVVVGRAQGVDAAIDDETISREHTRFELGSDGGVWEHEPRRCGLGGCPLC